MKRVRPPMPPLAVRVMVAERQMRAAPGIIPMFRRMDYAEMVSRSDSLGKRLKFLLDLLFVHPHLDHDPALILRPYNARIKNVAARYTPHAHDPAALIYREKADHQQKTTGRKPGATHTATTLGSDIHLKTKFNRLEGKTKPKRKTPIKSRGFQKGPKQKIQSRGFNR